MLYMDVLAQVPPPAPGAAAEPWYKAVAGIIAIPAAILTFIYGFILLKKTNLESRKLEIDLAKEEAGIKAAMANAPASQDPEKLTALVAQPLLQGRRVQEIVLRFIILYLILQAWSIVDRLFGFAAGFWIDAVEDSDISAANNFAYFIYGLVRQIPVAAFYLVILYMGGPIFIDCLKHLKMTPPRLIAWLEAPPRSAYVLVAVVVLLMGSLPALIGM